MPEVILNGEYRMLVDDCDLSLAQSYRWRLDEGHGYVYRVEVAEDRLHKVYFHRAILDAPAGIDVDHVNGNALDNRRGNLRLATRSQNMQNVRKARVDSTTGLRGVTPNANGHKFSAVVQVAGKRIRLGSFDTAEEAGAAAADARRRLMPYSPEAREAQGR